MQSHAQGPALSCVVRAWLWLAVGALALAAICAALLAATRSLGPSAAALAPAFALALVLHVNLAMLIWPLALASALWLWLASPNERWSLPASGVALASVAALLAAAAFAPPSAAVLSNYVPLLDSAPYQAALLCFMSAVGATLLLAVVRLRVVLRAAALTPAVRWAVASAALPTALAFAVLAWDFVRLDAALPMQRRAELLFWGPGHLMQFTVVALLMAGWLWLLRERPLPMRGVKFALLLATLPSLAALPIGFGFDIGSESQRDAYTQLMRWCSWPGPLLLTCLLMARRTPAESCVDAGEARAAWISIALFAAGLVVGALIKQETTSVPAHYHATLGAMTLALLGCVLSWQRRRFAPMLPLLYGAGAVLLVAGFALAGAHGAARKSVDVLLQPPGTLGLSLMGVGAVAMIGAVLWFAAAIAREQTATPTPHRVPDRRRQAALATALATAALGTGLAWLGVGGDSRSPAETDHAHQAEVRVRFDQGVLMLHARQFGHALTAFHRVLQIAPTMPEAHVNMGYALIGLGRAKEASDFFASALELRREQVNAYYGLAVALDAGGDRAAAVGAMRSYVHLVAADDPYRRRALAALWEWESEAGDRGDASIRASDRSAASPVTANSASRLREAVPDIKAERR
jgi:cytochrome c oxidase subunit 1